ncbi:helix-turn-helix domain-containing protein [Dendronalium sp. ChiSLP03b]|uniref:AlbA family DNA-binding domain-containing protein n=1 Tax=Dendronalium sp. ChiSLP03b TaxID=3075381 RepID=UPI00391ABB29
MTTNSKRKTFKEEFAQFFENPTREGFRDILKNNLGEFPNVDFKEKLPTFPKVARHLLGLANFGGGCLVIGVSEKEDKTLESIGVDELEDKKVIIDKVKKYLPAVLLEDIDIGDFSYQDSDYKDLVGKKFQVIYVTGDSNHLPFVSQAQGDGIRENSIYVRRGTSTEEANYEELQSIINRRLETGYSSRNEIDARTHIEQLKILYTQLSPFLTKRKGIYNLLEEVTFIGINEKVPNPNYPKENFEDFIVRIIEKKKKRIEIILDVFNLEL